MAKYVALLNWTEEGVRTVRSSVNRLNQGRAGLEQMGVRITDAYWTQGPYDVVLIVDASSDEAVASAMLAAGSQGFFRTQTLRAFTEDEFNSIIGNLPDVSLSGS